MLQQLHLAFAQQQLSLACVLQEDEESQRLLPERAADGNDAQGPPVLVVEEEEGLSGWRLICSSFAREAGALREGMSYIVEPSNRCAHPRHLLKLLPSSPPPKAHACPATAFYFCLPPP